MATFEERRSGRRRNPPIQECQENLEAKKEELTLKLETINQLITEEDYQNIEELRREVRTTHQQFRADSLQLSRRLHNDGRVQESSAVDEDRRTMREEFESCRSKLMGLGLAGSSASSYRSVVNWLEEGRQSPSNSEDLENPPNDARGLENRTLPRSSTEEEREAKDKESRRSLPPPRLPRRTWSLGDLRREEQVTIPRTLVLPPSASETVLVAPHPSLRPEFPGGPGRREIVGSQVGFPIRREPTIPEEPRRGPSNFLPSLSQNLLAGSAQREERERPRQTARPPFSTIPPQEPESTDRDRLSFAGSHTRSDQHRTRDQHPGIIANEAVREGIRADLIRLHESSAKFDGKNPEEFWGWAERLWSRIIAAGLEEHPKEQVFILASHTSGAPHRLVNNRIQAGLDNPARTLEQIWESLQTFYGSNDIIAASVRKKIERLKKIERAEDSGAGSAMQDLHGLCLLVDNLQSKCSSLRHYSSPEGMKILWDKLPGSLLKKWKGFYHEKSEYREVTLRDFTTELEKYIKFALNPLFAEPETRGGTRTKVLQTNAHSEGTSPRNLDTRGYGGWRSRTSTEKSRAANFQGEKRSWEPRNSALPRCPIHPNELHGITACGVMRRKTLEERKRWAHEQLRCFNCLEKHLVRQCRTALRCSKCGGRHATLMHDPDYHTRGKEEENAVKTLRVAASGGQEEPQVYSKTLPIVIRTRGGDMELDCLAIIDEQSSHTFVDERILEILQVSPSNVAERRYRLTTVQKLDSLVDGKEVSGLEVRGIGEENWLQLPPSLSHPGLPDTRSEMATPAVVRGHSHTKRFSRHFKDVDESLEVRVLIGANCGKAMLTRCYGTSAPFVHRTPLGYALVGPTKLGIDSTTIKVLRTGVQWRARTGLVERAAKPDGPLDLFQERPDDDLPGLSKEDEEFNSIVSSGIRVDDEGYIEIPLPFKTGAEVPENRLAVYHRSKNTLSRWARDPEMKVKCVEIMGNYVAKGHVRQLPPVEAAKAKHFIPTFIVKNKGGKLRPVFDSAARYKGRSFNDCLLQGPDENNKLLGILLRFRHHEVAFVADIETMFHSFRVPPEQRSSQCFFWFENNDPDKPIVPFTANVHVFGHTSSPSVANFGLRYASSQDTDPARAKARHFIERHFYVDDGLSSEASVEDAIRTLEGARQILANYGMRLHKIKSTHQEVREAFPPSELSDDPTAVTFGDTTTQKALGVAWKVDDDELSLTSDFKDVPFTKRGVLSAIGSIFDPLGIVAPVGLTGKLLQRRILQANNETGGTLGWDDKLPEEFRTEWDAWMQEIRRLSSVKVRRTYRPHDFGPVRRSELHVFTDASQESIGYVLYLRQFGEGVDASVAFVFGNSRVAPRSATTIPRLELCAAVAAAQCTQYTLSEIDLQVDLVRYYTDSLVVKGYLNNKKKRFSRFVTSRVSRILASSTPDQWVYVPSNLNPADAATRGHTPEELQASSWFCGPEFLRTGGDFEGIGGEVTPTDLPETILEAKVLAANAGTPNPVLQRLVKFSSWGRMKKIATRVFVAVQRFKQKEISMEEASRQAGDYILREVQRKGFPEVYENLEAKKPIGKENKMLPLNPWMDTKGIIKVGGRLQRSDLSSEEKHPIILPPKDPVTCAILSDCHESSKHQGRHLTMAALRRAGFHIMNPKNQLTSFLANCVICRWLRRNTEDQLMAQLPRPRTERTAPFEKSGMDVFGPYYVTDGKTTRRTVATKKVWVLLITCFYSRAVHLELIGSLDTPTMLLAFRRFTAIRGTCHKIWTDKGTNFAGAANQIENKIDQDALRDGLFSKGCTWEFTPTAAPHMGGVWERMVGSVKRVLDATLLLLKTRHLSRDEFSTVIQESAAIVNHTPLGEISCDPTEPFPVSPAMLLNLRESTGGAQQETSEADLLSYGSRRWRRVQHLSQQFWLGWRKDYLAKQQARAKWLRPKRNLMVGDIVLMREKAPRMTWPMAIVEEANPSADGLVRKVIIRLKPTPQGRTQRKEKAIHDLVLLVPAETTPVPPGSVPAEKSPGKKPAPSPPRRGVARDKVGVGHIGPPGTHRYKPNCP